MKKFAVVLIFLTVLPSFAVFANDASISMGLGMDFFNYQEVFLTTSAAFNIPAGRDMEVAIGAEFALWPNRDEITDAVEPSFFVPVNLGVQFVFSKTNPNFLLGMGVSPVFIIFPAADAEAGEEPLRFYAGPYVKGGFRLQIHEIMSWFLEVQQDLGIGKPNWVNTATRVITGINFKILANTDGKSTGGSKTVKK
ncbi:MAG: hypothetical protein E4H36_05155 [Spirochaetales bacterium]|nr:MAG: hypothetical protein E4H36_05155 [Spirochaetales bacterium]